MSENTTPTAAEMEVMRPAFLEALAKSQRDANKKTISKLASDLTINASRMKYLAMAASCVADGSGLGEADQMNCAGYLIDILEYLAGVTSEAADNLERAVSEAMEGAQA